MLLAATAALLCVVLSRPSQEELEELVDVWISELNDDASDRRIQASKGLLGSGAVGLRALRSEMESPSGPESKLRALDLVLRMDRNERLRRFGGGAEVCGFAARLIGPDREIVRGDPAVFEIEVQNLESTRRPFVPVRSWGYQFPGRFGAAKWNHARLIVRQLWGEPIRNLGRRFVTSSHCGGPDRAAQALEPGGIAGGTFTVNSTGFLPAGGYEAYAMYLASSKGLVVGADRDLETNRIRFIVRDRNTGVGH